MIAIVAHDAGGAEIVSSYVREQRLEGLFVLEGPAQRVFARKLGPIDLLSLEDAIDSADSLLCGTSWQSDLELRAIALARSKRRRSVAFLDHWVCYQERFVRAGRAVLPDEIWVGDGVAEVRARTTFPDTPIRLVDNPYFHDLRRELAAHRAPDRSGAAGLSVVYVCEPLSDQARLQYGDPRHWGYVEEEALRYFLQNLAALERTVDRVVIRPHPAEPPGKYTWARDEFDLPIETGGVRTLVEEIVDADVVVGCESMAMVIGLLAGKRVISSIPPGGQACSLPHPEIQHLQQLVGPD